METAVCVCVCVFVCVCVCYNDAVEYMTKFIYNRPCDGATKNSALDRHPIVEY